MSKMSGMPAMLVAIDPADSQIQSSVLEFAGKLHEAFSQFAVHTLIRPRTTWPENRIPAGAMQRSTSLRKRNRPPSPSSSNCVAAGAKLTQVAD
jgi:hypothetical protein